MGVPLDPMGFQRGFCGILKKNSMVFLWYFHGMPAGFLLDLHETFMGFLWDLCDIPGRTIWDS